MRIRAIQDNDWPAILTIQDECYPDIIPETRQALQSKVNLSATSCYVVEDQDKVVGYCLAHPWPLGTPPSLEQVISTQPASDSLYLHDIAFSSQARGLGAGQQVFQRLITEAKRLGVDTISLVAVGGADTYWQRLGFKSRIIDKSLDSYPQGACYMVYQV